MPLSPLQVTSLKQACIHRLEELILSGELKPGQRLPAERDLAARLGISRPVLHEALVDLAAKGLVRIQPRHGVTINDFRTQGSVAILSSLLAYHQGNLDPQLVQSLMDYRMVMETECARLAALHRQTEDLQTLQRLLAREADERDNPAALTALDFDFHLRVALASGNHIYPLIINSFQGIYTNLTRAFFDRSCGTPVVDEVLAFQARLVTAIEQRQAESARQVMAEMLRHGENLLKTYHCKGREEGEDKKA